MKDWLLDFLRSSLGKRLIAIVLATLGVSVTYNELNESATRIENSYSEYNSRMARVHEE